MSERASETGGTPRTAKTMSTYLTDENEKNNSARTKDSYKVRFFDGKAPGTADDGRVNKEPHPHNQNWGRTGLLLMEGGTIILRLLFDEKVKQVANGNFASYLKMPANYQILFDLYQGKVLSPLQWDILYPKNNAHLVSTLELDIIILHILVMNTCQYKGDILMDIQSLEKRRDSLYEFTKDARINDAKFDTEYEAVGAVLSKLTISRELGREVESRIKNMVKNLKTIMMTKEEIVIYLDILKRWYLSDIDIRKAMKELKVLLKNGQGDTKRAKDILAKLKMLAEDDSNKLKDMAEIKEDLKKLASELEGMKKKNTKLKTVLNILSIMSPRFSQPFNIESVALSIPYMHTWFNDGVQFSLSFYCQGQLHVYTKATKLVVEAKLKVFAGDERSPQGEIAAIKSLNTSKLREQLIADLRLGGVATLSFKERSFLIVPIETSEQGYRKLLEIVKIPLWKTTITNVFQNDQLKSHLNKGGCLCVSGGDPTVMLEVRCRGSDIALSSLTGESITTRPSPFQWQQGARKFIVKKYFLGKQDVSQGSSKGANPQCVVIDLTVKKGTKIDPIMEAKFGDQLNEKIDLKALLSVPGVSSVKCDDGKSTLTIAFTTIAAVKEFHDKFRYEDVKIFVNKLFKEPKVMKIFGNAGYNIYVDVTFSVPEVECKGLPEPAAPTCPRNLKVSEVTTTSVTITWEEPESFGGTNLTGFIIERQDVAEKKWVKVGVAEPDDTKYNIANLTTSHEYFFRITAENLAGTSPAVETSDSVILSRTKAIKRADFTGDTPDKTKLPTPHSQTKPRFSSQNSTGSNTVKAESPNNEEDEKEMKNNLTKLKETIKDKTKELVKEGGNMNGIVETAVEHYTGSDDKTNRKSPETLPKKDDVRKRSASSDGKKAKKTKKRSKSKTRKSKKSPKTYTKKRK